MNKPIALFVLVFLASCTFAPSGNEARKVFEYAYERSIADGVVEIISFERISGKANEIVTKEGVISFKNSSNGWVGLLDNPI